MIPLPVLGIAASAATAPTPMTKREALLIVSSRFLFESIRSQLLVDWESLIRNGTLRLRSRDSPLTVISGRADRGRAAGQSALVTAPALLRPAHVAALRVGDRYHVVDGTPSTRMTSKMFCSSRLKTS